MRSGLRWALGALLLCATTAAPAASLFVESTAKDHVGQNLVYQLKNKIGGSAIHKLVYGRDDAGFVINVITLEMQEGRQTSYSAVLLMPPVDGKGLDNYVTSQVGFCGADVTTRCAEGILAGFDDEISQIVEAVTAALKDNK